MMPAGPTMPESHRNPDRRAWLGAIALGGLAAAGRAADAAAPDRPHGSLPRRIDRIEVFPVRYPTAGRFRFFEGPPGVPPGRPAVLVKITADDGVIGWGESVPLPRWSAETLEGTAAAIRDYLAPAILGMDPFDQASVHRAMDKDLAPSFSTGAPIAKAGIDLALHDLTGRALGVSLARRWGRPAGGSIELSWTLNPKALDEIDAMVTDGRKRGYRHFNVKVAPDPVFDLELCRRVRALAPEAFLWADANGGFDPDVALEIAPKLADAGVDVFEQPVAANRLAAWRDLRRQHALPIIMDEGVVSPADLIEFLRLDLLDGVAMKPARCGGLEPARRQVEILRDAGMIFLGSGLTDPDVSLAASLALYGAYGLDHPAALNGPQFLTASVLAKPFSVEGGRLRVPDGPGLGIEVSEDKVKELLARSAAAPPK